MSKRILVTPLNWGLGHATRCVPIIDALVSFGFEPIIGSDGSALSLLKKEFHDLRFIELPSYNISYPKKGAHLKFKLLANTPKILKAIQSENELVQRLVDKNEINGIISDNRFGVYNKVIPSVYLTHQLNVLSGNSTWMSTKLHQKVIKKFDECWVPDCEGENNLSGQLGHVNKKLIPIKYIGPLSRFNKKITSKKYSLMVLLSGPEPQRSILEEKLLSELKYYKDSVIFIKGIIESEQKITVQNNLKIYNYMTSSELETTISESDIVLSRSGYTTIMDLAKLENKAFFIPTPGQNEQIYLAEKFQKEGIAPFCYQDVFNIEKLNEVKQFKGFLNIESNTNYEDLFSLF